MSPRKFADKLIDLRLLLDEASGLSILFHSRAMRHLQIRYSLGLLLENSVSTLDVLKDHLIII